MITEKRFFEMSLERFLQRLQDSAAPTSVERSRPGNVVAKNVARVGDARRKVVA
jgi:hypothetical protein